MKFCATTLVTVFVISGCATSQPNLKKNSFAEEKYNSAEESASGLKEIWSKKVKGLELYYTTKALCTLRPVDYLNFLKEDYQQQKSAEVSDRYSDYLKSKKSKIKESVRSEHAESIVDPFTKVLIFDVETIPNVYGEPRLFLVMRTEQDQYVAEMSKESIKNLDLESFKKYLLGGEKNNSVASIDCFSSSDPHLSYNLSPKDIQSIKSGSHFVGVSSNVLILAKGKPQAVNTTTVRGANSQQWVYPAGYYYYFRNGKLDSWQSSR